MYSRVRLDVFWAIVYRLLLVFIAYRGVIKHMPVCCVIGFLYKYIPLLTVVVVGYPLVFLVYAKYKKTLAVDGHIRFIKQNSSPQTFMFKCIIYSIICFYFTVVLYYITSIGCYVNE